SGGGGGSDAPPLYPGMTAGGVDFAIDAFALEISMGIETRTFTDTDCAFVEGTLGGTGTRRLLTFDTIVVNWGQYDAHIGDPADPVPPLVPDDFVYSPCHMHYHFVDF